MRSLWRARDLTKQKKIENLKKITAGSVFSAYKYVKDKNEGEKEDKGDDGKVKQTV